MKKKKIAALVIFVILVILLGVGGGLLYMRSTPEYALAQTVSDVKEYGIDGLKEHLTYEMWDKVNTIKKVAENPIVGGLVSWLSDTETASVLMSEIQEIEWTLEDVLKGDGRADAVIGFYYNEDFNGTVNITMSREKDGWKIDGIQIPSFN